MNEIHLHLAINHFPVIVPIVGALCLLAGMVLKSVAVKKTALILLVVGGVSAFPAYQSGENAEALAENLPGVEERYIHEHEEAAETFSTLSYILAGFALLALIAASKKMALSGSLNIITLVFSVVVIYFGTVAGTTGGEIRHPEIRKSDASTMPSLLR